MHFEFKFSEINLEESLQELAVIVYQNVDSNYKLLLNKKVQKRSVSFSVPNADSFRENDLL